MPSAMESEPYSLQANVTQDVRADGTSNQPVDCFTRFKRVVRGEFHIFVCIIFKTENLYWNDDIQGYSDKSYCAHFVLSLV